MNNKIRAKFPSLLRTNADRPIVYLDGPAGTQVPESVINAVSSYYQQSNANTHGFFKASSETDAILDHARRQVADFLGAAGPHTISFGQNMTTLNFALANAMAGILTPGDEILITQLDHEANRGPWLELRSRGIVVREIKLLPEGRLDYEDFQQKLTDQTRLVAMGYASNILGTINDVQLARQLTHQAGAWLLLDAVHYAPHFPIDVRQLDCDFLLCSAYKFYGPHVGILYSKPGLLDRLPTQRLRTQDQQAPYRIETGTLNHAAIAGVTAAIEFIASLCEDPDSGHQLREAMKRIHQHEWALARKLYEGLQQLKNVEVFGPAFEHSHRAPTLSFAVGNKTPEQICQALSDHGISGWDGHFYALRAIEILGMLPRGGVTRLGISLYNLPSEIDYTLEVLERIIKPATTMVS